jgi:hypothetical protein
MIRTQFPPDFFVAEHYDLRNIIFWWFKDLALEWAKQLSGALTGFVRGDNCQQGWGRGKQPFKGI